MSAKVLLLCNNKIALPAMKELLFYGHAAAIVVPAANKELLVDIAEAQSLFSQQVPVITVNRKNFENEISNAVEKYNATAAVMMTFPFIISKEILSLPAKGFINFHYGRLPQYRGPEPIFTQIIKQEKNPGLTVHVVTEEMDAGPVILEEVVLYNADDTYGTLQQKLAAAGAKLINVLMKILSYGSMIPSVPQDESKAAYHKKPSAADLMIDWQMMDSSGIIALVNACNPWNKGCGTLLKSEIIRITEAEIMPDHAAENTLPGTVICVDKPDGLMVSTVDHKILKINIVFTESGFMSGWKLASLLPFKPGEILGNISLTK